MSVIWELDVIFSELLSLSGVDVDETTAKMSNAAEHLMTVQRHILESNEPQLSVCSFKGSATGNFTCRVCWGGIVDIQCVWPIS